MEGCTTSVFPTGPNIVPGTAEAFHEYLLNKEINIFGACLHLYEKPLHLELSFFCQFFSFEGELLLNSFAWLS